MATVRTETILSHLREMEKDIYDAVAIRRAYPPDSTLGMADPTLGSVAAATWMYARRCVRNIRDDVGPENSLVWDEAQRILTETDDLLTA